MGEERQEEEVATLASYKCSSSNRVVTVGGARWFVSRYAQNPTQKEVARGGYGRIFCGREEVSGGSGSGGAGQNFLCVCQLGGNIQHLAFRGAVESTADFPF